MKGFPREKPVQLLNEIIHYLFRHLSASVKLGFFLYWVCLALLPFQDQPAAIRGQRILEVQQRKEQYLWGQLPPGVTDLPGFIHAPKHSDLAKDAQFSDEKTRSFHHGRLHGVANLGLSYLCTLCDSWENFDSFKKIFTGWTGDVPRIADNDLWLEDRMFGYQFLNGCNPCVIERCYELPSNFPVTNEMVQSFLDRGRTLEEEIEVKRKLLLSKRYWLALQADLNLMHAGPFR